MYIRRVQKRVHVQNVPGLAHKQTAHKAIERMRSVLRAVQQRVPGGVAQTPARRIQAPEQPALQVPLRRLRQDVRDVEQAAEALARSPQGKGLQVPARLVSRRVRAQRALGCSHYWRAW